MKELNTLSEVYPPKSNSLLGFYESLIEKSVFVILTIFLCSFSSSAQTDLKENTSPSKQQKAVSYKFSENEDSKVTYVAQKELEEEINLMLNKIREKLADKQNLEDLESNYMIELNNVNKQFCSTVSLETLIDGTNSYSAHSNQSDQELKCVLNYLKHVDNLLNHKKH